MELNTKILIADENVEQRNFLKENLFRAGYRNVDIALNGEDAFLKISSCRIERQVEVRLFPCKV